MNLQKGPTILKKEFAKLVWSWKLFLVRMPINFSQKSVPQRIQVSEGEEAEEKDKG